jgi:hypothetical protein
MRLSLRFKEYHEEGLESAIAETQVVGKEGVI